LLGVRTARSYVRYVVTVLTKKTTMTQVSLELPETLTSVLHCAPEELDRELRLAAAIQWYRQGRISQEWAARIAGMDRTDFLLALARMGKDSFVVDFDDLDRELDRG
jgi:predicted HTH domain antitoxin